LEGTGKEWVTIGTEILKAVDMLYQELIVYQVSIVSAAN